jgi:hypothetical protein
MLLYKEKEVYFGSLFYRFMVKDLHWVMTFLLAVLRQCIARDSVHTCVHFLISLLLLIKPPVFNSGAAPR